MKRNFPALCAILCTLFLVSCSKDEAEISANLMIVNASPNGSNIDAAVNGNVIVSNMPYPNNSGYKEVNSGSNNVTVTATGSGTSFINGTLIMEAGSYYSLYVTDSANKRKETITRDDLTPPAAGKAKIRVLHLSPNAPAIDISITGAGSAAVNFTGRSFNDVRSNATLAAFQEVEAGGAGLNVQATVVSSSTVIASVPLPALTPGKIYSFIIKGFVGGIGAQALGVEVITHN
jgi:hypothetical protein